MKSIIVRAVKLLDDFVYTNWQTSINKCSELLNSKMLGKGNPVT